MRQTKKSNVGFSGMKVHVGTDKQGLVHSVLTTDAAQADITQLPDLIHGRERELYGDGAYWR
jgi:transposase, IS5 family